MMSPNDIIKAGSDKEKTSYIITFLLSALFWCPATYFIVNYFYNEHVESQWKTEKVELTGKISNYESDLKTLPDLKADIKSQKIEINQKESKILDLQKENSNLQNRLEVLGIQNNALLKSNNEKNIALMGREEILVQIAELKAEKEKVTRKGFTVIRMNPTEKEIQEKEKEQERKDLIVKRIDDQIYLLQQLLATGKA